MCMSTHRHSLHCILPPYILSKIAENGSPALRAMAMHSLLIDPTIRIVRASTAGPVTGDIARRRAAAGNILVPSPLRTIRDAGGEPEAPGSVVVRREGEGPTGDIAVDEAYDGLGATFALFWEAYQRNSIDDAGLPLDATVHYDQDYDNAFWDGTQMVFGDGDGELFNRFTVALDVIGHELTHGVTEKEAGLAYFNQSGALNESISDVFGSLVKQKLLGQTADQADWLIGAGLLTSAVKGVALRSMKEPGTAYDDPVLGKDPQPGRMDDFVRTNQDNGGVHINSGIPNRAFYLAATAIGGNAWDRAGRIWYSALLDPNTRANTDFAGFARVTIDVAGRLHGVDSGWSYLMQTGKACDETVTGEARVRIEGGLAHFPGLAKEQTISFGDLATPERQELTALADQADFFGCEPSTDVARPDARTYTVGLTIDGRSRVVRLAEPIRDPAMAKLVSVVRRLSKQHAVGR